MFIDNLLVTQGFPQRILGYRACMAAIVDERRFRHEFKGAVPSKPDGRIPFLVRDNTFIQIINSS